MKIRKRIIASIIGSSLMLASLTTAGAAYSYAIEGQVSKITGQGLIATYEGDETVMPRANEYTHSAEFETIDLGASAYKERIYAQTTRISLSTNKPLDSYTRARYESPFGITADSNRCYDSDLHGGKVTGRSYAYSLWITNDDKAYGCVGHSYYGPGKV